MSKEHLFRPYTKKQLVGKTITSVGDDYISVDGGITIYIDDNNEIKHLNEMFNEWDGLHSFPDEGWAIFSTTDDKGNQIDEVQHICELEILESDLHALPLAISHGYQFNDPRNPYRVTNMETLFKK